MSHTGSVEGHFVLEEIESRLKAGLETLVDQGALEEFSDREYPEIRSEIGRQTAALIQKARHGAVRHLAPLIRTAVNSWRPGRGASPGRKRRTYPRRGSPGPPGCTAYSQRCLSIRGHALCRPAHNPRDHRPSPELLRRHRLRVLDYLPVACT